MPVPAVSSSPHTHETNHVTPQTQQTRPSELAFSIIGAATYLFNPIAHNIGSAVSVVSESLSDLSHIFSCSLAMQPAEAASSSQLKPLPSTSTSLSSEECLKFELKWFETHDQSKEVQGMQEQQPTQWLINGTSYFSLAERSKYPELIEGYNQTILSVAKAYQHASKGFQECYLKWQNRIHEDLQTDPQANLKKHWPTLSFEKALEQFAMDCQRDLQQHSFTFLHNHLQILKTLYKDLLVIQNTHKSGIAHPHLTKTINRVLKQATYNYISIDANNRRQLAQVATHIFVNWKAIAKTGEMLPCMRFI